MKRTVFALLACLLLPILLIGCRDETPARQTPPLLGNSDTASEGALNDLGIYDGYFEGAANDITVTCLSGTANAYTFRDNVLTFTAIGADTVYAISGRLRGSIVIDVGSNFNFDLELHGLSLVSDTASPITAKSGNEISIKAKKGYMSYLYDLRPTAEESAGAIESEVDLELGGKGRLYVLSKSNEGICTKDDLQLKNLTLYVVCCDNALKGSDSVTLESGTATLITTEGDAVKTSNSNVSSKGNQRGNVEILGGTHTIYSAGDGIDAAHDMHLSGAETHLSIHTGKYSDYFTPNGAGSATGIQVANAIEIRSGSLDVIAGDDALRACKGKMLENGHHPNGNVTVSGGTVTLFCDGESIRADGSTSIAENAVTILPSPAG